MVSHFDGNDIECHRKVWAPEVTRLSGCELARQVERLKIMFKILLHHNAAAAAVLHLAGARDFGATQQFHSGTVVHGTRPIRCTASDFCAR